jgi:hypothetical protein
MKKIIFAAAMVMAFLLYFSLSLAYAYGIGVTTDPNGYSSVYRAPDPKSPVLTKVKKGELFLVIAKEGEWSKIFALDNTIGYIPRKFVSVQWTDAKSIGMVIDTEGYTTLFAGPSTNHKKIGKIPENMMFIVIGKDSWFRVVTRERVEGFVLAAKVAEIWP